MNLLTETFVQSEMVKELTDNSDQLDPVDILVATMIIEMRLEDFSGDADVNIINCRV